MGNSSRGLRTFLSVICFFIIFTLILAAGIAGAAMYFNAPPKIQPLAAGDLEGAKLEERGPHIEKVLFDVHEGESAYAVGQRLEKAGLIKTRYFWNMLSRMETSYLKAGTYRLFWPMSQTAIRATLVEGRQVLLRVTIPEGVTLKKAAAIMDKTSICSGADFLAAARDTSIVKSYKIPNETMEGYLYPETYFFPGSFPADKVIKTMADTFFDRIREIAPESQRLSLKELNNVIILASIVEREYRVDEEAPIMAGVFYNRIKSNISLESCATVQYIITEIHGKPHPYRLFFEDIEMKHPYNTYVNPGLPPGPISCPGRVALNAAFHPAQTDFLFFRLVNEAAGRHYFSKTLDAHIKAANLFVKS